MTRVQLRGDKNRRAGPVVMLDGSCLEYVQDVEDLTETPSAFPTLTVRQRTLSGYADDGNPEYTWATVLTGASVEYEERREVDDIAGRVLVKARAVMLVEDEAEINEGAIVESSHGGMFNVRGSWSDGEYVELEMDRMDDLA